MGWDIVLAGACKAGLHLSVGVCLAADVVGDVSIITYVNLVEKETDKKSLKNKEDNKELTKKENSFSNFNPLEFVMSVGLMAIILVLI